jgi:hypothetical protein
METLVLSLASNHTYENLGSRKSYWTEVKLIQDPRQQARWVGCEIHNLTWKTFYRA